MILHQNGKKVFQVFKKQDAFEFIINEYDKSFVVWKVRQ